MDNKNIKWWKKTFYFIGIVFELIFEKRDSKSIYEKVTANQKRKKFNSKSKRKKLLWVIGILILIVFIATFPALINSIVLYNGEKFSSLKPNSVVAQDNDWIGFLGSYMGSIIGGIIGGAMTLIGVLLTIRIGNKEDMIESYPLKRKNIRELKRMIEMLNAELSKEYYKDTTNLRTIHDFKQFLLRLATYPIEFDSSYNLSNCAGKVDGFLLMIVLDFIELNEEIDKDIDKQLTDISPHDILLNLKLSWNYTYKTIKDECDKIMASMETLILKK